MPIKKLDNKKIAYVHFGDDTGQPFLDHMNQFYKVTQVKAKDLAGYKQALADYNLVIIGFHKNNDSPWKGYKFTQTERLWLEEDRKSTRLNSSHVKISYAVFCLKKKKTITK